MEPSCDMQGRSGFTRLMLFGNYATKETNFSNTNAFDTWSRTFVRYAGTERLYTPDHLLETMQQRKITKLPPRFWKLRGEGRRPALC